MRLTSSWLCAAILGVAFSSLAHAQQVPWIGGADDQWSNPDNWDIPGFSTALPSSVVPESALIGTGDTVVVDEDLNSLPGGNSPPAGLDLEVGSTLQVTGTGHFRSDAVTGFSGRLAVSGGSSVLLDSGASATIDGPATFSGGSLLSITGAAGTFSASEVSFDGSTYTPILTSGAHTTISTPGDLSVSNVTLRPTFSGFTPAPSDSWVLADAGGFSLTGALTLDTSQATLPAGFGLQADVAPGGTNGLQLTLSLGARLTAVVNADTGAVSLVSESGQTITTTGYSLTSGNGQLNPAGLSSLGDQIGGGWSAVPPRPAIAISTVNEITEIAGENPATPGVQDSLAIGGAGQSLGNAFTPQPFGVTPDVSFQYTTSTLGTPDGGDPEDGLIQITGLNAVNNLLLTVDPNTGDAELMNSSTSTIRLKAYDIQSADGSLQPADGDWNSLDDQNVGGPGFVDEASPDANRLTELIPSGAGGVQQALTLTPGQTFDLGELFDTTKAQDLELEFLLLVEGAPDGDFDDDGSVAAGDYALWRDTVGSSTTLANEAETPGSVTAEDYDTWAANFGESGFDEIQTFTGVVRYASLASAAVSATAVPEPQSVLLLLFGVLGARGRRPRKS